MKVVHLSTTARLGGAGKAAFRLHEGLRGVGVDSRMLVLEDAGAGGEVSRIEPDGGPIARLGRRAVGRALRSLGAAAKRRAQQSNGIFSLPWSAWSEAMLRQLPPPDVVNLHWVAGLVTYRRVLPVLTTRRPVVWTLHDMNPFTGGCHYAGDCRRFQGCCGRCPQQASSRAFDLSRAVWRSKAAAYRRVRRAAFAVVSPSHWLAERAGESSLLAGFPIEVIPNGLDLDSFAPREKRAARRFLGIPDTAKVVLFNAHDLGDPRKGGAILLHAMEGMRTIGETWLLLVGSGGRFESPGIRQRRVGFVNDDHLLALLYSAADVFALPALEDNLPNTALESLACGTPVVAFRRGGIPDVVRAGATGVLVDDVEAPALRAALEATLADSALCETLSRRSREVAVAEFSVELQAKRYLRLYQSLRGEGWEEESARSPGFSSDTSGWRGANGRD